MIFEGYDLKSIWQKDPKQQFVEPQPTDAEIAECEKRIGFKLPLAYIELMKQTQNGGLLAKNTIQQNDENGNTVRTLTCTYLWAIGENLYSMEERKQFSGLKNLPDIGIYFAENQGARRTERFALDYSSCGPDGEPCVSLAKGIRRDGKSYYETTVIAWRAPQSLNQFQS
ncbi:MAG: SMI1/KNR4 family protein [Christensenellaceae bacterium]|jgi:hypothetical protein